MKPVSLWAYLSALLLLSAPTAEAADETLQTVMVQDNEIVTFQNNDDVLVLTHDGTPKSLPVWSKDGALIAFVEKTDRHVALGRLVVIDGKGTEVSNTLIRPRGAEGAADIGMRYIETLEWPTERAVSVSGSVNPSTSQYVVIDVRESKKIGQFFDDGSGAAFSPNGRFAAWESGCPHFTPSDECVWTLSVNGKPAFEAPHVADFILGPRWSPDSRSVAVIGEAASAFNASGKSLIALVWHADEAPSIVPLPVEPGPILSLYWFGKDLVVLSRPRAPFYAPDQKADIGTWRFTQDKGLDPIPPGQVLTAISDRIAELSKIRGEREELVRARNGREADYWCRTCPLAELPRRVSVKPASADDASPK